jgi:hypothetical protein
MPEGFEVIVYTHVAGFFTAAEHAAAALILPGVGVAVGVAVATGVGADPPPPPPQATTLTRTMAAARLGRATGKRRMSISCALS